MKWLFVSATAITLALATPALAAPDSTAQVRPPRTQLAQQSRDQNRQTRDQNQRSRDQNRRSSPPAAQSPQRRTAPARPGARTVPTRPSQPRTRTTRERQTQSRQLIEQERNRPRYDWGRYQPGKPPPPLRNRPSMNLRAWQRNFGATRRYHAPAYHRPSGWYSVRWVFGMVLPTLFWTHDYWIIDYWEYGLPNPPYGYVWVRYGDDALLVSVSSGYILQVVYNLFD